MIQMINEYQRRSCFQTENLIGHPGYPPFPDTKNIKKKTTASDGRFRDSFPPKKSQLINHRGIGAQIFCSRQLKQQKITILCTFLSLTSPEKPWAKMGCELLML